MAACGNDSISGVSIRLQAPPPLDSTGQCPVDPPPVPLARGPDGPTTLRLTYLRSADGTLLCDVIVPIEGPSRIVGVPRGADALTVDLLVEAFRGDALGAVLVASGQALSVDLDAGGEVPVMVAPRDEFRCTVDRLGRGRAFHSATTLPNGEVLLVGGLVPDPNDPSRTEIDLSVAVAGAPVGGFYATASVEVYDPQRGTFTEVAVPALAPRAFHEAYLLPQTSPDSGYGILLVGGITTQGDPAANPAADGVRESTVDQILRMVPAPNATGAPTVLLTYYPDDRPATAAQVDTAGFEPRMFQAATRPPSGGDDPAALAQTPPLVAGGWSEYPAIYFGTFEEADLTTGMSVGDDTWQILPGARAGATITRVSPNRALVWGGNLSSAAMMEPLETGNIISGLSMGTPTSALATFDPLMTQPAPRVFHTATALSATEVLVVGGFGLTGGSAGDPLNPFAQIVGLTPGSDAITLLNVQPAPAVPVGYHDAVPLLGGDVLITGGNAATGTPLAPCPDTATGTHLCSVNDVYRWRSVPRVLEHQDSDPLLVARWGHRSAVLLDGTVLITGGFRYSMPSLMVVREGELYNPRTEAHDPAAASLEGLSPRLPGDVARNADGTPYSPCALLP